MRAQEHYYTVHYQGNVLNSIIYLIFSDRKYAQTTQMIYKVPANRGLTVKCKEYSRQNC